jgi:hypothetical protein
LNRAVPILIVVFLATALAATGYGILTAPFFDLNQSHSHGLGDSATVFIHQGIVGNAQIANIAPLCTVSGYRLASGPNLIIISATGGITVVPLEWNIVNGCGLASQFQIPLQLGSYGLTLSPCNDLGCKNLPLKVEVKPGTIVSVNINIATGIY